MIASINITLDLTKAYTAPVELVQGEKLARRLYFTVTNGGALINMTGKAVCLQITKPDGTSCLIAANVTAVGKCYVDLTAQAVAAAGNAKCQLIIMTAEAMGSATSGTATSMYDTAKTWTVNDHVGKSLYIYAGTGAGQIRNISANSATQLTVDTAWTVNPAAASAYAIIAESGLSFPFPARITASDDVATAAESSDEFSALVAALALTEGLDAASVHKSGAETIADVKTFTSSPIIPNGTTSTAAVNKGQLDSKMNIAGGSGNPFTAMPYVSTSPIVESGSNANGYYIKFADGTMICTKSVTFTNAAMTNATGSLFYSVGQVLGSWAANFYAVPMTVVDVIKSPDLIWQTTTVAATTSGAPTIVLFSALSTTVTVVANVIAIGRWKA